MNAERLLVKAGTAAKPDQRPRDGIGTGATSERGILIGYARCSTERQDLTAQREILI